MVRHALLGKLPFASVPLNGSDGPFVPLTVKIYRSGNNPGIQSLASLAGKLSRKGARCVSDFSAPTASSSAVTFRA